MSTRPIRVNVAVIVAAIMALASSRSRATQSFVFPPPDIVIGDAEDGAGRNMFVFPDAFNLDSILSDDNTSGSRLLWSYRSDNGHLLVNGAPPLSNGDPLSPPAGENIRLLDDDTVAGGDGRPETATVRNQFLSPISINLGLGPYAEPATVGLLPAETTTLTLFASDGSTYSQTSLVVYTANDTSDSLSGGNLLVPVINLDFENNPGDRSGWFGAVLGGMGSTSIATGLCMSVSAGADPNSAVGWVSPPFLAPGPNFIQLVDKALYRVRLTLYTNQTADSAIPYCDWQWSNYVATLNDGNSYGGLYWLLDVAGGATGIGRNQSDFNIWITPNAALTAQWRGLVDAPNSAFDPSVDFKNDFSFTFRVLHDNAALNTPADSGTICLRRLRVDRVGLDQLATRPLFDPPISSQSQGGSFFRDPDDFGTVALGDFTIDEQNHWANVALTGEAWSIPLLAGSRRRLLYDDVPQPTPNRRYFPVQWERDRLYMIRAKIRSNVGGPDGTVEGWDPLDAILLDFDTPNSEFGMYSWTMKGSNGNFTRAASPRLTATTAAWGGAQPYVAFIQGPQPSLAAQLGFPQFEDSDRLRGFVDLFDFVFPGVADPPVGGKDPLTVESVEILEVVNIGG